MSSGTNTVEKRRNTTIDTWAAFRSAEGDPLWRVREAAFPDRPICSFPRAAAKCLLNEQFHWPRRRRSTSEIASLVVFVSENALTS